MKIWRPKNLKAVALIRLTLWSGLLTWMVCTLAFSIVGAQVAAIEIPNLVGTDLWGRTLTWVVPIWIVFTTLMLIWAVIRFATPRLRVTRVEKSLPERKKPSPVVVSFLIVLAIALALSYTTGSPLSFLVLLVWFIHPVIRRVGVWKKSATR